MLTLNRTLLVLALLAGALDACAGAPARFLITEEGGPAATIVLAKDATRSAQFAAVELREHVRRITGATLPIARDDAPVAGRRILVGESAATRRLGLAGSAFKRQEYLVRVTSDTLVLMGRDQTGQTDPTNVAVTGAPQWVPGKSGRALRFDGKGDALTVADPGFSDAAGTMALWVYWPAQPQSEDATLLRLDGAGPWTYHILRGTGRRIAYVTYDGTAGSGVTSGEIAEGWHYVAATHDEKAGRLELFVDGVSQGTAKFTRTTCKDAPLHVGGIAGEGKVGNAFAGVVDEVLLSSALSGRVGEWENGRTGAAAPTPPLSLSPTPPLSGKPGSPTPPLSHSAGALLHFDEGAGAPRDSSGVLRATAMPDLFEEQGTCYAVYDFLEQFCGVRWYAPGEVGMVVPERKTLAVAGKEVRRAPAFRFRQGGYLPVYGILKAVWNNPSGHDVQVFARRMRLGGEPYAANHSFYGYYDRYWKQNPQRAGQFEGERPDWFAQGYAGQPPQMCFTNEGFVRQVIQDARDYFDGKGAKPGAQANGDFFALVPMDNSAWCKCPACAALLDPKEKANPHFSNGWASDYVFGFANKVAKEIRKSHPDKYLATLAYSSYAYYPKQTRLESNMAVQMCLHVRNWWQRSMEENDMRFYRSWVTQEKDRPIYLWLYYCFPEEVAMNGKWHCFPGFFAHTLDRQWKMFAKDGIRGAFMNNLGDYLDTYLTFRAMDDPTRNVDREIEEFHRLYYGAAAEPMKRLYLRIEEIFSHPDHYPDDIRSGKRHSHQTEEMAWGYLGTEERMAEMGRLMAQAAALARTDLEKQRVALFEKGIWEYMLEGRRRYAARQALNPEVEKMKAQAPPRVAVPRVAPAGGDAAKVDWERAALLGGWRMVQGWPADRKPEARIAHDGEYLYVHLQEPVDPKTLVNDENIWAGDDWEVFLAAQRAKPARQVGINPKGYHLDVVLGEGANLGDSGVKVVSDTSAAGRWTVRLAFPLAKALPGGLRSGGKFYANFYRATAGERDYLAWSPNFVNSFHELGRLGEFTLE